jgi:hypothetical protein
MGGNDENSMFEWLFREILPREEKFRTADILCISDFGWGSIVLEVLKFGCKQSKLLDISEDSMRGAIALSYYFIACGIKAHRKFISSPVDELPGMQKTIYDELPQSFETRTGLLVAERYGMWFPHLFKDPKAETLFYQKEDGTFEIYTLKENTDYKAFASHYLSQHPQLTSQHAAYLYGREKTAGQLIKRKEPDPQLPEGIEGWDWMGCLFPQFYVLCHAVKSRWSLYFLSVVLLLLFVGLSPLGVLYLLPMLALGKNGRALTWLSHRWESRSWFEKNYKRNNQITLALGIAYWLLQLSVWISWLIGV